MDPSKSKLNEHLDISTLSDFNLDQVRIRSVSEQVELLREEFLSFQIKSWAGGVTQCKDFFTIFSDGFPHLALVALYGHEVVGSVAGVVIDDANTLGWVGCLAVNDGYRRRGVARKLMADLTLRMKACTTLALTANVGSPAEKLYCNLGYCKSDLDDRSYFRGTPPENSLLDLAKRVQPFLEVFEPREETAVNKALLDLDYRLCGVRRGELLERLFAIKFIPVVCYRKGLGKEEDKKSDIKDRASSVGIPVGYAFHKLVGNTLMIGPLLCETQDFDLIASMLLQTVIKIGYQELNQKDQESTSRPGTSTSPGQTETKGPERNTTEENREKHKENVSSASPDAKESNSKPQLVLRVIVRNDQLPRVLPYLTLLGLSRTEMYPSYYRGARPVARTENAFFILGGAFSAY